MTQSFGLKSGGARARVSAYADDVFTFVSSRSDIEVVLKALDQYEKLTGTKINRDKSSGLRISDWKEVDLSGPFGWTDGRTVLSAFLVCGLDPTSGWRKTGQKYRQSSTRPVRLGTDGGCP